MSGDGCLIITASAANEPAWENPRTGHGYFTHFLIEAMLGVEGVVESGHLPVYRLLEFVTRRVIDAARQFGHAQNPTLRGTIDGELIWPVFVRGPRYRAAFPERIAAPIKACFRAAKMLAAARRRTPGRFEGLRIPGPAAILQIASPVHFRHLDADERRGRLRFERFNFDSKHRRLRGVGGFAVDPGCRALGDDLQRSPQFSSEFRQAWRSVCRQSSTNT